MTERLRTQGCLVLRVRAKHDDASRTRDLAYNYKIDLADILGGCLWGRVAVLLHAEAQRPAPPPQIPVLGEHAALRPFVHGRQDPRLSGASLVKLHLTLIRGITPLLIRSTTGKFDPPPEYLWTLKKCRR
eukprot:31769-Prorocentrum_minimum.AAC.1